MDKNFGGEGWLCQLRETYFNFLLELQQEYARCFGLSRRWLGPVARAEAPVTRVTSADALEHSGRGALWLLEAAFTWTHDVSSQGSSLLSSLTHGRSGTMHGVAGEAAGV